MRKFSDWYKSLGSEESLWLAAIFLSGMLGTALSGLVLKWGMSHYGDIGWQAQLSVSLAATAVYGAVVVLIFYVLLPECRLVFKQMLNRKK